MKDGGLGRAGRLRMEREEVVINEWPWWVLPKTFRNWR